MSKVWKIACEGKTLPELKKALEGALRELDGGFETSSSVKVSKVEVEEDEYVDESEISTHIQQAGRAPRQTEAAPTLYVSELDAKGVPWDARIHASSKAKVADGSWRYKRGVDDSVIAQVEGQSKAPVAPPVFHAPPPVQSPVAVTVAAPPVQAQVVAPVAPPMPQMSSGHTLQTFCANFPMIIGTLVQEGKINQEYVNTLNAHFGVDQIWKINDEQKALVFNDFASWGFVKRVG